jgi:regulator of nonsense transcripts 1
MSYGGLVSNGSHKPAGSPYPMPRIPLPAFATPLTQPYAIPSRGAVHGPIGGAPQGPQTGNRGFGMGRGSAGGPIGGHLPHHQLGQQLGNLGSGFNFGGIDNPSTQASVGGALSQTGLMTQAWVLL